MDSLSRLAQALRCLPGVGPKSAQRMVYHLLHNKRDRGLHLASCLEEAMLTIRHCEQCNNYTVKTCCELCENPQRDASILCVVESPADVNAIEHSQVYKGNYYVLMGKISPIDGIGPEDIGLPRLQERIKSSNVQEVILALGSSVEGITTSHVIQQSLRQYALRFTQLAHGIPSGGELEFLDGNTIGSAVKNRSELMA